MNQLCVEAPQEQATLGATHQQAGSKAAGSQKLRPTSSLQGVKVDRE